MTINNTKRKEKAKNGNKKGKKRHETIKKNCNKRKEPAINNKKLQEKAFRVNFEPWEVPQSENA